MKYYIKKSIIMFLVTCFVVSNFSYAKNKNPYEGEVEEPAANPNVHHSENTIIDESSYDVYNPINPVKVGVNQEEYNKVDNFNIDLNTLGLRIKYFSPTYKNIRQSALSSYTMAYYARGGNDDLVFNPKTYTAEILDLALEYKKNYEKSVLELSLLKTDDPNYAEKRAILESAIQESGYRYNVTKYTYDATTKGINSTKTMLGLTTALYNMANVDNNARIKFAHETIEKSLKSAILSYLQLETYVSILEKQTNLYYDIYKLNEKNLSLGTATSNDVLGSLANYEAIKDSLKTTKTTMENVKKQIATNLGYNLSDIEKLQFIEPVVDYEYLNSVNFDEDKIRAYTSNSSFTSVTLSDKDKKLPQSTGEEIYNNMKEYVSLKVMTEFENIYNKLLSAKFAYDNISYQERIYEINIDANKRKFDNKLVSELEYKGLELQNLSNELQIKITKYNLITAMNDYYYAALGHIDIS